jgi:hypothetical protein
LVAPSLVHPSSTVLCTKLMLKNISSPSRRTWADKQLQEESWPNGRWQRRCKFKLLLVDISLTISACPSLESDG